MVTSPDRPRGEPPAGPGRRWPRPGRRGTRPPTGSAGPFDGDRAPDGGAAGSRRRQRPRPTVRDGRRGPPARRRAGRDGPPAGRRRRQPRPRPVGRHGRCSPCRPRRAVPVASARMPASLRSPTQQVVRPFEVRSEPGHLLRRPPGGQAGGRGDEMPPGGGQVGGTEEHRDEQGRAGLGLPRPVEATPARGLQSAATTSPSAAPAGGPVQHHPVGRVDDVEQLDLGEAGGGGQWARTRPSGVVQGARRPGPLPRLHARP